MEGFTQRYLDSIHEGRCTSRLIVVGEGFTQSDIWTV